MASKSFGELTRESRRRLNKSLQDVADALNVSAVYVSEVERGKRPPFTNDKLPTLADILQIDLSVLQESAWSQKGMIELDPYAAGGKQMEALMALARGGLSESDLQRILDIATGSKG